MRRHRKFVLLAYVTSQHLEVLVPRGLLDNGKLNTSARALGDKPSAQAMRCYRHAICGVHDVTRASAKASLVLEAEKIMNPGAPEQQSRNPALLVKAAIALQYADDTKGQLRKYSRRPQLIAVASAHHLLRPGWFIGKMKHRPIRGW